MERSALNELNRLEETPSDKTWEWIGEQLDRRHLHTLLETETLEPDTDTWLRIRSHQKKYSFSPAHFAMLMGLFLFAMGFAYWSLTPIPTAERTAQAKPTSNSIQRIESERMVLDPAVSRSAPINPSIQKASVRSALKQTVIETGQRSNYLLVASRKGEPLRVPKKWESLSCCLSGEAQSLDCDQQQRRWHAEVLQTELGFQADPFLGLIDLINCKL